MGNIPKLSDENKREITSRNQEGREKGAGSEGSAPMSGGSIGMSANTQGRRSEETGGGGRAIENE